MDKQEGWKTETVEKGNYVIDEIVYENRFILIQRCVKELVIDKSDEIAQLKQYKHYYKSASFLVKRMSLWLAFVCLADLIDKDYVC